MGDDLVEELEAEATRLSGRSLDKGCVDSGLAANLAAKAAADLARLRAENEALRTERDAYRSACKHAGVCMTCVLGAPDTFGCTDCLNTGWDGGDPHAQLAAAEAKAARLETALRRAIALAEVMLTNDPNETISDAGHTLLEWWMAELENLRAALEAKP